MSNREIISKNVERVNPVAPEVLRKNGNLALRRVSQAVRSKPIEWNEYLTTDARQLGQLFGDSPEIDVTITSPPYWDAKDYGSDTQIGFGQSLDDYLNDLTGVFTNIWKCTKQTGSLWVVINSIKKDGRLHLLPSMLADKLTKHPLHSWYLQDELIWHKTHTLPWVHRQKLTDTFEHILCFSKSKSFSLDIDAVRSTAGITNWWVKYPERYHPQGKTLSNVWEIEIPTQGSWGNGHFAHACPLPLELVKRIILMSSGPKGTVLDPFAGTGSTVLAAHELGRRWLALDLNPEYRKMFHQRLAHEVPSTSEKPNRTRRNIEATNLSLRQLKFGLLLYKRVAPGLRLTPKDIRLIYIVSGSRQRTPSPYWVKGTQVTIVLSDELKRSQAKEVEADIAEQLRQPPLSKFQLDVTVKLTSISKFKDTFGDKNMDNLYIYQRGEFWNGNGPHSLSTIQSDGTGRFPPLISDILVQEQPAY